MKNKYSNIEGWITNYAIEIGFNNLDDNIMDDLGKTAENFKEWLDDKTPASWSHEFIENELEEWLNKQCE
tara:strand:+ start:594 stop:803 length:210 start_codon:yes stop_codon:yes gene_type:complete